MARPIKPLSENAQQMLYSLFRDWYDSIPQQARQFNPVTAEELRIAMFHIHSDKKSRLECFNKLMEQVPSGWKNDGQ